MNKKYAAIAPETKVEQIISLYAFDIEYRDIAVKKTRKWHKWQVITIRLLSNVLDERCAIRTPYFQENRYMQPLWGLKWMLLFDIV